MTEEVPVGRWLKVLGERAGRPLDQNAGERLEAYAQLLLEASRHQNLTGLKDRGRLWREGIGPSLALWPALPPRGPLVDLQAGAGLVGVVLACLEPERPWWLIDSRQRRSAFLLEAVARLAVSATVVNERPEVTGHGPLRQQAAGVTTRGLGCLGMVAELSVPLLRSGGRLVSPRGDRETETTRQEMGLIALLGGSLTWLAEPGLHGFTRRGRVALIEKRHSTPRAYPRRPPELGRGVLVVGGEPAPFGEGRALARRGG